ncbi:MAG: 6,7-dimethyl-8-ribityllumazine synthase [Planctomycetes bacterium]|nr:6,7-dimethyl-8-ribityllumazine synthase [Planctomycetota bacterium]MCB9918415.1 6,7-dimethyl-8-ribityllumazine synthase [Planctomycetota bacterium]
MVDRFEANIDGRGKRIALVASRFNELVTRSLLDGALDALQRHGVSGSDLAVAWVPGAFEIPLVARRLATSGQYDGVVCLGALIRGATPHFEYISSQVSRGIATIAEDTGIPASFGVLTCDTQEQALERAGSKAGNKGVEAALACLEAIKLLEEIDKKLS